MEAVREMKDKDKKQADKMEEDFKEMAKNAEEAMLQVPKDLDIFADLNVGNDLVEDVTTAFEEVKQQIYEDIHEKKLRLLMAEKFQQIQDEATVDNYLAGTSRTPRRGPVKAEPTSYRAPRAGK